MTDTQTKTTRYETNWMLKNAHGADNQQYNYLELHGSNHRLVSSILRSPLHWKHITYER